MRALGARASAEKTTGLALYAAASQGGTRRGDLMSMQAHNEDQIDKTMIAVITLTALFIIALSSTPEWSSCTRSRPLGRRKNHADVTVTPTPARAILAVMCGRFTQHYTWAEVHAFLDLIGPARNLRPHYNLAPTDTIDVVRLCVGGRELIPMRGGARPFMVGKASQRAACYVQRARGNGRSESDV